MENTVVKHGNTILIPWCNADMMHNTNAQSRSALTMLKHLIGCLHQEPYWQTGCFSNFWQHSFNDAAIEIQQQSWMPLHYRYNQMSHMHVEMHYISKGTYCLLQGVDIHLCGCVNTQTLTISTRLLSITSFLDSNCSLIGQFVLVCNMKSWVRWWSH